MSKEKLIKWAAVSNTVHPYRTFIFRFKRPWRKISPQLAGSSRSWQTDVFVVVFFFTVFVSSLVPAYWSHSLHPIIFSNSSLLLAFHLQLFDFSVDLSPWFWWKAAWGIISVFCLRNFCHLPSPKYSFQIMLTKFYWLVCVTRIILIGIYASRYH